MIAILLYSCAGQKGEIDVNAYKGEVTALMNGTPWEMEGYSLYANKGGKENQEQLSVTWGDIREGQLIAQMSVRYFPAQPGIYPFTGADSIKASFALTEHDVLLQLYRVIPDYPGSYIEVESFNPRSGRVKGRFEAAFYRDERELEGLPDTLWFTQGYFDVKFLKK